MLRAQSGGEIVARLWADGWVDSQMDDTAVGGVSAAMRQQARGHADIIQAQGV